MIENYRTGLLWNLFMQNPEIGPALTAVGFVPDNTPVNEPEAGVSLDITVTPNPVTDGVLTLNMHLNEAQLLSARLRDVKGKTVQKLFTATAFPSGEIRQSWPLNDLSSGLYFLEIVQTSGLVTTQKVIIH
jgi:hypothetical protein